MFRNGDTPKNIMNSILTTNGGLFRTVLKEHGHENLLGANPYGLFHFGNKDYKVVLKSGEPTQNIFETITRPAWGDDENKITNMYALDEALISLLMFSVKQFGMWRISANQFLLILLLE